MAGENNNPAENPENKPAPPPTVPSGISQPPADNGVEDPAKVAAREKAAREAAEAAAKKVEEAAAAEAAKKAAEAEWDGQWVEMPDPSAQAVVNLLKAEGVTAREAQMIFKDAMDTHDPSKVKWDVVEEKLGKDKAALARAGVTDYYNRQTQAKNEVRDLVFKTVGGQDNYEKINKWVIAQETADSKNVKLFDSIRKGFDAGGRVAELAAKELVSMYEADPKNNGLGTTKITAGTTAPASNAQAISKADFQREVQVAYKANDHKKVEELRERRRLGIMQGI